jgi:hypothetical protein
MKNDPAAGYFPIYFVIWVVIAIVSTLVVRTRKTASEKKKWSDRFSIIIGIFVTGFITFILILWKAYIGIPLFIAAGLIIGYANIKNAFYCDKCNKRSVNPRWFSSGSFYCPHCGHKLRQAEQDAAANP